MKRVGLIGGMSWESTSSYYTMFHRFTSETAAPWVQPRLLIDSVDFSEIVTLQRLGDWDATGAILVDSARRLQDAGATVLGIGANTMHMNFDAVADAVTIPVIDIRDAVISEVEAKGATSVSLLGTKYLMENDFYSGYLEARGIVVVKPTIDEVEELHSMIFTELTQGIVTDESTSRFMSIAASCRRRGSDVIALCCTEFGMLVDERNAPWPFVDSTAAHVRALLAY